MAPLEFEEVWRLLQQLEGQPVTTLVSKNRNRVSRALPAKLQRQTETQDKKGWQDASAVSKATFRRIWDQLAHYGRYRVEKYFAAACLVAVPGLGVTIEKSSPLTIKLQAASAFDSLGIDEDEAMEGWDGNDRIVLDPKICHGKPTIRDTRIMVSNILGMFAGEYTINLILEAYPELSRLDVTSAVEYASWVVDRGKVVA